MKPSELELYRSAFEMAVDRITAEQAQAKAMTSEQQTKLYQVTLAAYLDTANQWLNAPHQKIIRGQSCE